MLTVEQVKKATLQEQVLQIRGLKVGGVFCAKTALYGILDTVSSTGYNSWEK
jgi:hypothetical protein